MKENINTLVLAYGDAREALGRVQPRYGTEQREMLLKCAESAKRKLDAAIAENINAEVESAIGRVVRRNLSLDSI